MAISISTTKDSSNRTVIVANPGRSTLATNYRFRVYTAGGTLDFSIPRKASNNAVSFAIEDYAGYFINPFPEAQTGSFNIALETNLFGNWSESEKISGVSYPIYSNAWTRPTLQMSLHTVNPQGGYYMKGVSSVRAEFSGDAKCGAYVKGYNLRVEGNDYGSPYISNVLATSDKVQVIGTVTDSRGYTAQISQDIWVISNLPSVDVVSCSTRFLSGVITVKYTPANSVFFSKLLVQADVGGVLTNISELKMGQSSAQKSHTFSFTSENLAQIYNLHPATTETKIRVSLLSYTNSDYSEKMSGENSREIVLAIPNDDTTVPQIKNIFVVPAPVLAGDANLYVKGKNGVKVIAEAEGKFGASVGIRWKCQNIEYGNDEQSSNINITGPVVISVVATDSRGFSSTELRQITVIDYKDPSIIITADRYFDREIGFTISPANDVFCTRIKVFLGAEELQGVQAGRDTTAKLTLTSDNLAKIYRAYPNSAVGSVAVKLFTYSSDNYAHQYGEEKTQNIELSIPYNNDTMPKINKITVIGYPALLGTSDMFVKGQNGAKVNALASAEYGGSITEITYTLEGETVANNNPSRFFSGYGIIPITIWVKDSRGFTNTATQNINVLNYYRPVVAMSGNNNQIVVQRANSSGEADSSGEYLYIGAAKSYSSLNGKNKCILRVRKKPISSDYGEYTTILSESSASNEFNGVVSSGLDRQTIYYVEISVLDSLGAEGTYQTYLSTEGVYMDRSGSRNSIAFGGHVTEDDAMEVYWTAYFRGGIFLDDLENETRYRLKIGSDGVVRAIPDKSN